MESAHLVLGAVFGSFPAMDIRVKVIDFSYREGGAIEQYKFCTAAILDFKMAATKIIFNKSIFYITHTIIVISRVITFEYCFV